MPVTASNTQYSASVERALTGQLGDLDATTTDVRAALLDAEHNPKHDVHAVWDDVRSDEVAGHGYKPGGKSLQYTEVVRHGSRASYRAVDVIWEDIAVENVKYCVVYVVGTGTLLSLFTFSEPLDTTGAFEETGDFVVSFDSDVFAIDAR